MTRLPGSALPCLLVAIGLMLAAPARVEAKPDNKTSEAKTHYENGIRKFDLGKYDEAAEEFVQAYELVGEPAILYNIAQSYRLGERFEKSAQFYRSFLRRMSDIKNRQEIEGRITEMEERAADQRRQAERRVMEQREAERKAELRKVEMRKNQAAEQLRQTEPPPREAPVEEDHAKPGRTLKLVGYGLCGLTAASLGLGIAMSVLAKQASNKVENAASAKEVFSTELRDTESRGKTYDTVAIVGYAVAGAAAIAAGASIYLGFRAEKRAQADSASAPRGRRIAWPMIAPSLGKNEGGFVLAGRF